MILKGGELMKKIISAVSLALGAILISPTGALAAITINQPEFVKITDIGKLLSALIGLIFIVAAIIFFFMLVIGGIQWMLSGGDKQATESARGRITAALIGLIIVFAAWAITKLIEQFLGITILGGAIQIPNPF